MDSKDSKNLRTRKGADAFLCAFLEWCRERLAEDGALRPIACLLAQKTPSGERVADGGVALTFVGVDGKFGDVASKQGFDRMLRREVVRSEAVGAVFAVEVWSAIGSPLDKGRPPAERPDRTEHVMINFEHVTYPRARVLFAPIHRDANGKPTMGEAIEPRDCGGRFLNLMGREGAS